MGRLRAFRLSAGNVADITAAPDLPAEEPLSEVILGDQSLRRARLLAYWMQNAIERTFYRPKDWRRIVMLRQARAKFRIGCSPRNRDQLVIN
jgi:hypothetical protein